MTQRRRTTWNDRKASAPPATPGYAEGTNHPAYPGPDPDANKYMNGDPSSWAEDPHPGPYPNPPPPPADPGMQEPQGHPATDPAHYFPAGTGRQAASVRQAMEQKASKCIRLASMLLGKSARYDAVEDQALDFMHLSDRAIQAALARVAETEKQENYTLTPERSADDLLADEDKEAKKAKKGEDEEPDADDADKEAKTALKDSGVSAEETEEEKEAKKKAAHFRRLASEWEAIAKKKAAPSGNQNDPAHYNYDGTDLGKNKTAADDEDEKMLAEMMEEESKKAASAKKAKDEPFGGKKAPPFGKKDDDDADKEAKKAKKGEDEPDADDADKEAKKAKKGEDEPDADDADKEAKKAEDEKDETDKEASVAGMLAGMMDDEPVMADDPFGADPMDLMDAPEDAMSPDEMAVIYGGRFAKKSEEETKLDDDAEADKEAKKAEDESKDEEKKEAKKAAVKPQPRLASNGPRTLGTVPSNNRTASNEVSELSKLWESAPDVSKNFR